MTRSAKRVLELVAIRDRTGTVHPRGKVIELDQGRVVFYRDVTQAQLVEVIGGWAIEVGLLAYLALKRVFRVHYRLEGGPLLATDLETFTEKGAQWDKGDRQQLVLPSGRWTQFAPSMAYEVPRVEVPWTVVDHATGEVVTELPYEPTDPVEEMKRIAVTAEDERKRQARLALGRLRESAVASTHPWHDDVRTVLGYLWDVLFEGDEE